MSDPLLNETELEINRMDLCYGGHCDNELPIIEFLGVLP